MVSFILKMIGSSSCDTVRLDIEKLIHYISNENFSPVCDDLTILPNGLECSMIRLLFYILLLNRIGDQDIQEFLQTSKFDYILPLQQDLFVLLLNIIKTHKEMQTLCFRILKSCLYISKNEVVSKVSHQYKEKEVQVSVLHKDQYEFSFFYELMDSELMMILIEHNSDPLYSYILDLLFQLDKNLAVLYMDELFKNESTIRSISTSLPSYMNTIYIALMVLGETLRQSTIEMISSSFLPLYMLLISVLYYWIQFLPN